MRKMCAVCVLGTVVACHATAIPTAPNPSPHFDPVAAELQLGGTVFAYVDVDGDAERVAAFVSSLLRSFPGSRGPRQTPTVSAKRLVMAVGLDGVRAIGVSSYDRGELYHNRSFVYRTGPREGLLRLLGDDPRPFALIQLASPTADFVWEQQLDVQALIDVARALGAEGFGPSPGVIDDALSESLFGLDITLGEVIDRLDTTFGLMLDVDERRILRAPGDSFWFPYVDFLFQVDGLGEVVEAIARRATFDPFIRAERTSDRLMIQPGIRLPPPWNAYAPSLVKDEPTGRVYLASSPEFLDTCLAVTETVATTDDYRRAFEGLPDEGNGMLFMSRRLTRELHGLIDRRINESGPSLATTIARFMLPDAGSPVGWVAANRPNGILFTSNSPSSHKATLVSLGYAALLPAIVVFAAAPGASIAPAPP